MRERRLERFAPLTGLVFLVLAIVSGAVGGDTPDTDDSTAKVVSYWSSHDDRQIAAAILGVFTILFFLWFAASLRAHLRAAEGSPGRLSNLAFGGALVLAGGGLVANGFGFAAADTVNDVPPEVTQTLSVLSSDIFFPFVVGAGLLLFATGLLSLRTGALPRWLAWAGIVLGVLSFTPIGFFAFLASILWVAIISIVLFRIGPVAPDEGPSPPPAPAAGTPPPAAPTV